MFFYDSFLTLKESLKLLKKRKKLVFLSFILSLAGFSLQSQPLLFIEFSNRIYTDNYSFLKAFIVFAIASWFISLILSSFLLPKMIYILKAKDKNIRNTKNRYISKFTKAFPIVFSYYIALIVISGGGIIYLINLLIKLTVSSGNISSSFLLSTDSRPILAIFFTFGVLLQAYIFILFLFTLFFRFADRKKFTVSVLYAINFISKRFFDVLTGWILQTLVFIVPTIAIILFFVDLQNLYSDIPSLLIPFFLLMIITMVLYSMFAIIVSISYWWILFKKYNKKKVFVR